MDIRIVIVEYIIDVEFRARRRVRRIFPKNGQIRTEFGVEDFHEFRNGNCRRVQQLERGNSQRSTSRTFPEVAMVALFVILFIVVLLGIDLVIQIRQKRYPLGAARPATLASTHPDVVRVPRDVFFHPGHTWARLRTGDDVTVGIDDFIQKSIGVVDAIEVPAVGTSVRQGEPAITVRHADASFALVAPMSGRVSAVNRDVLENPALLAEDPYAVGWLFQIEPSELANGIRPLALAEQAVAWVRREAVRLRDFLAARSIPLAAVGETMLDGGIPVAGAVAQLDDEARAAFEHEFLRVP
jgi:glycine cleavage system H protein